MLLLLNLAGSKWEMAKLRQVKIKHVVREGNALVDRLAAFASSCCSSFTMNFLPPVCYDSFLADYLGISTSRKRRI